MLGKIEMAEFKALSTMPQEAASAWSGFEQLIGVNYVPLLYVGKQVVKGTNYYFIAEQTVLNREGERHLVLISINGFGEDYEVDVIKRIL